MVLDLAGRSPKMALAPSVSLIARDEGDPCHCGTATNLTRSVCHAAAARTREPIGASPGVAVTGLG